MVSQPTAPPPLQGIHHIKIAVSDLDASLHFYETVFGAKRIPQLDHRREHDGSLYAYILDIPDLGCKMELRLNPEQAEKHRLFDPVTLAVSDLSALKQWALYLDERKIPHSPIITAIQAWIIVIEDPDQNRFRLYTLETHGRELPPDEDNPWLQD
jgi:extradiol dioxygenase family protein